MTGYVYKISVSAQSAEATLPVYWYQTPLTVCSIPGQKTNDISHESPAMLLATFTITPGIAEFVAEHEPNTQYSIEPKLQDEPPTLVGYVRTLAWPRRSVRDILSLTS